MKKALALVLALTLSLSLVACGGGARQLGCGQHGFRHDQRFCDGRARRRRPVSRHG